MIARAGVLAAALAFGQPAAAALVAPPKPKAAPARPAAQRPAKPASSPKVATVPRIEGVWRLKVQWVNDGAREGYLEVLPSDPSRRHNSVMLLATVDRSEPYRVRQECLAHQSGRSVTVDCFSASYVVGNGGTYSPDRLRLELHSADLMRGSILDTGSSFGDVVATR